ncbi:triose-phosphate isomerase [Marinobacterium aestuarii]|uniref:Triosephosphate isomerase n=1 Tax=Marinobacterium aestuarii TaxID=1821621 RepID=A0A1A9F0H1_9GAMM|nr:triose-phosphate isomerase [Marinobacterium aestuarii]ANG63582.1 triose-phosphate isomerase [Marinobacterium aestuarii]
MMQSLVIGNWKMNGSLSANEVLLDQLLPALIDLKGVQIVLCPPFPYISQADSRLLGSQILLGAQNLNAQESGAHTGEVSARMLKDLNCRYVLIGHSERRSLYGETDTDTAQKLIAAKLAGLIPVLCVGESLQERQSGSTETVVARQLQAVIDSLGIETLKGCVIAYEPVWAIGTGETATPEQAQAVHGFIRRLLARQSAAIAERLPLLYGGSVKADNAAALLAQADINGALVGGASLDAAAFAAICQAAALHN